MGGLGRTRRAAAAAGLMLAAAVALPGMASANEWVSGPDFIDATIDAGWNADSTAFAGTVATHSQFVTVSGVFKIDTSIVSIVPQPGFGYTVKKSGGLDSAVEVTFSNGPCQAQYKLLIKPGLTKIDGGVMRCR